MKWKPLGKAWRATLSNISPKAYETDTLENNTSFFEFGNRCSNIKFNSSATIFNSILRLAVSLYYIN